MSTTNTDFLPNQTGQNLGSPDQRWDIFGQTGVFDSITVSTINTGPSTADSVQILSTSQAIGFAAAIHTMILATGGVGGIALTLPSASAYPGQVMKIKKVDSGAGFVSVVPPSGTIDGLSSYDLSNEFQYVNLEAGNGAWQVVGNN